MRYKDIEKFVNNKFVIVCFTLRGETNCVRGYIEKKKVVLFDNLIEIDGFCIKYNITPTIETSVNLLAKDIIGILL